MALLKIPAGYLAQIYRHGGETYPEEACGVISGPLDDENLLDGIHPFENKLGKLHRMDPERYPRDATDGYHMDPLAYMKLEKTLAAQGRKIKLIYHTHPDCGAYFSEEDISQALWEGQPRLPGVVYLVCGVKQRQPDGAILARFNPANGGFDVTPLEE